PVVTARTPTTPGRPAGLGSTGRTRPLRRVGEESPPRCHRSGTCAVRACRAVHPARVRLAEETVRMEGGGVTGTDEQGRTGDELDVAMELFATQRRRLFGIAYRMLGTVADAEDIV